MNTDMRSRFDELQQQHDRLEGQLSEIRESVQALEQAESLTNLELEPNLMDSLGAQDGDIMGFHRKGAAAVLSAYLDEYPRRRKIPLERIAEEYGDGGEDNEITNALNALVESHDERVGALKTDMRDITSNQISLIGKFPIRPGGNRITYAKWRSNGSAKWISQSYLRFWVGFVALWWSQWVPVNVRSQRHCHSNGSRLTCEIDVDVCEEDVELVRRIRDLTKRHQRLPLREELGHYFIEHGRKFNVNPKPFGSSIGWNVLNVLMREADEHPDYPSNHLTSFQHRPWWASSEEQEKAEERFENNRTYASVGEVEDWFTRDPEHFFQEKS